VGGTIDEKDESNVNEGIWEKKAVTEQSFDNNCKECLGKGIFTVLHPQMDLTKPSFITCFP